MNRAILSTLGVCVMGLSHAAEIPTDPAKLPKHEGFPDPLVMLDGTKVTTKEQWETKRKPELKALFQRFMYGNYPSVKTEITAKVLFEDVKAFGGTGTLREVELSMGIKDCPPMYVLIALPNERPKAGVPVFVGTNFAGNHTILADERIHLPTNWMPGNYPGVKNNKATAEGRGKIPDRWPLDLIVKNGYGLVTFYSGDVDPDNKAERGGMRAWITPPTAGEKSPDFTESIMAWAWGIHRAIDYVVTVKDFDPKRIAVLGHSRMGKTALLAGAFDERIAVTFPIQAGCGGTGPSRHEDAKAEGVKRINTAFPHWFCDNFKKFNDDTSRIPFDQHCLVALCAPRPVMYPNAKEDLWANPSGQFDMLKRATPVYELLGVEGMTAKEMPSPGKLVDSRLGYWVREGKHEVTREDWTTMIAFANKWMK